MCISKWVNHGVYGALKDRPMFLQRPNANLHVRLPRVLDASQIKDPSLITIFLNAAAPRHRARLPDPDPAIRLLPFLRSAGPDHSSTMAAAAGGGAVRALSQKEQDIQMMLAADVHLGTKNCDFQTERYVFKRRSDGMCLRSCLRPLFFFSAACQSM
jgi:hypothetical protein